MFREQRLPYRATWVCVKRRGVVVIESVHSEDHLFVHFMLCWAVSEQQAKAIAWRKIKKHYGGDVFAEEMGATVDRSAAVLLRSNGKNDHRPTPPSRHRPQLNLFPSDALLHDV